MVWLAPLGLLLAACVALWLLVPALGQRWRLHQQFRRRVLVEDVLKHVYLRNHQGPLPSAESVSGHLGLPTNKALDVIMSMERAGLLRTGAGQITLTENGEKWAVEVVRAHRLWETYLAQEARLPISSLHRNAERAEHYLTATGRVDALAASLGYPNSDPHGDPIPTAGGGAVVTDAVPLTAWPPGKPGQIAHLEDEPERFLRQIAAQGLKPGGIVQVVESTPEEVVICDGVRECRVPPLVAANIHVIPVGRPPEIHEPLVRLSDLKPGEGAEVVLLEAELRGFIRRRLLDLGLTPSTRVVAHLANAFGDPLAYRVRGATIALRKDEASRILVRKHGQPAVDDAVEARTA